jgi:hypothetical protein
LGFQVKEDVSPRNAFETRKWPKWTSKIEKQEQLQSAIEATFIELMKKMALKKAGFWLF